MKRISILIVLVLFGFSSNSCHKEKANPIDYRLLQSDWLNAKYNYILFFNDSIVVTAPNESQQFLFSFHTNFDTLFIENIDYKNRKTWEKYLIMTLNSDLLVMKNLSKNNIRLPYDTISLINIKTINFNNLTYKKIFFSYSSLTRKMELELIGDSLKLTEFYFNNNTEKYHYILSADAINRINRKLELVDPGTNIISVPAPGVPIVSIKIEFNDNVIPIELKNIDPAPNIRLAGFIAYLKNLDKILDIKGKK